MADGIDLEIEKLTKCLESNFTPSLVFERSRLYIKSGDYVKALKDFTKLIDSKDFKDFSKFQILIEKFSLKELRNLLNLEELLEILLIFNSNFSNLSDFEEWKDIYCQCLKENVGIFKFFLILQELLKVNKEFILRIMQESTLIGEDLEIQEIHVQLLSNFVKDPKVVSILKNGLSLNISIKLRQKIGVLLIQNLLGIEEFTANFFNEEIVEFLKKQGLKDLTSLLMIQIWKNLKDNSKDKIKENIFNVIKKLLNSGIQKDKEFGLWVLADVFRQSQEVGLEFLGKEEDLMTMMEYLENDSDFVQIAFLELLTNVQNLVLNETGTGFLDKCLAQTQNSQKKSLAASILCKSSIKESNLQNLPNEQALNVIIQELESENCQMAKGVLVEALALKSLQSKVKLVLLEKKDLIQKLIQLTNTDKDKSIAFGIVNIFLNIGNYKERLSQEQEQVKKLQAMSKGAGNSQKEDPLEEDAVVESRNKQLVQQGVMEIIVSLSKDSPSQLLSDSLARCLLNLTVDKNNRGKIIQQGGLKALLLLLKSAGPKGIKDISQSIAKLLITTDPSLAFKGVSALEFVKPLIDLCRGDDLLCQFESLLALTNLASIGPNVQSRIIQGEAIKSFESLIFSDHTMIRRAATELVCNLMYEPAVFERYVNCGNSSRLKLMVALSDCEDFETRRAASGVLAILSASKEGLISLSKEARFFQVLKTLLLEESEELLHRSLEVFKNCLVFIPDKIPSDLIQSTMEPIHRQTRQKHLGPLATQVLSLIKQK